jgi:hypothetical protein
MYGAPNMNLSSDQRELRAETRVPGESARWGETITPHEVGAPRGVGLDGRPCLASGIRKEKQVPFGSAQGRLFDFFTLRSG